MCFALRTDWGSAMPQQPCRQNLNSQKPLGTISPHFIKPLCSLDATSARHKSRYVRNASCGICARARKTLSQDKQKIPIICKSQRRKGLLMDTNHQSFEIIAQSFLEVLQESINKTPKDSILPIKKGYLAKISMLKGNVADKEVFLLFDKAFLTIITKALLEEESPDKATLEDMAKELANLIVGHAKVLAKGDRSFNISVPSYLGYKLIKDYDSGLHFKLGRGHCGIYIRKA